MKCISLNVEVERHTDRILPFLEKEKADIVCLQESTQYYEKALQKLGYTTCFLPRCKKNIDGELLVEGILLGSLHPVTFKTFYYSKIYKELPEEVHGLTTGPNSQRGIILGTIQYESQTHVIGTTHFTWTPNGSIPNQSQQEDMVSFIEYISTLPPHCMCGDFNIPRYQNPLYTTLTEVYEDEIPKSYTSSLDKKIHRLGAFEEKAILFESYMVDYIFTQPPYSAENVRLEFGVSDHTAVVATILKN